MIDFERELARIIASLVLLWEPASEEPRRFIPPVPPEHRASCAGLKVLDC